MTHVLESTPIVLRDGRTVFLRPLQPDDRPEHKAFVERLSRESSRMRFFVPIRTLDSRQQDQYFDLDWTDRVALVAHFPGESVIRGVGRYAREAPDCAEVAFVVDDSLHGQGIGTALLVRLAEIARAHGIHRFSAWVLPENTSMLNLFRRMGWPIAMTVQGGLDRVVLQIPALVPQALAP